MRFLHPNLAWWSLLLPVIGAAWLTHRHIRAAARARFPISSRFLALSRRSSLARDVALMVTALAAGAALLGALVRPQMRMAKRTPEFERQDLIIMLDRSASMRARDIAPSRLTRALYEIRNFVQRKPPTIDRVALIGFADASVVLSYLTSDEEILAFYLDWIDGDAAPLFGTNMGAALKSALAVTRKDDRATRKVFLLLSDGEDQGSELEGALAAARDGDYHVNCIGIGSDRAVPIPIPGSGGEDSFLLDPAGRQVLTQFNEGTLRDIAARTDGRYVRSTTGHELQRALIDVVTHERRLLGWRESIEYRDLYQVCLAVATLTSAALWRLL